MQSLDKTQTRLEGGVSMKTAMPWIVSAGMLVLMPFLF